MNRRAVSPDLFKWVGCYLLLGGVPFAGVLVAPDDFLQTRVAGSDAQPVRAGQVAMWFPRTMLVAALMTLAVGLTAAAARHFGNRTGVRGPTWVRTFVAVFGVSAILAGVILVWLSIVGDRLAETVPFILVCISLGMGLATGATYYREE